MSEGTGFTKKNTSQEFDLENETQKAQDELNGNTPKSSGRSIGASGFGFMARGTGGEYTRQFEEALNKLLAAQKDSGIEFTVHTLDRDLEPRLRYSYVALCGYYEGNAVYHTFVLEATGKKPATVREVSESFKQIAQATHGNNAVRDELYVAGDAIDGVVINGFKKLIGDMYKNRLSRDPITLDGMVITHHMVADEESIRVATAIGYNSIAAELAQVALGFSDVNIVDKTKEMESGSYLNLRFDPTHDDIPNEVGNPMRADFRLELTKVSTTKTYGVNDGDAPEVVATVSGYIDAIPENTVITNPQGMAIGNGMRFHPHIIITNIDVEYPTLGYALLAYATSMIVTRKDVILRILMPQPGDAVVNDWGVLNLITNIDNNENGGTIIGSKVQAKLTQEQVARYIDEMFSLPPVVSIDVELNGPNYGYLSALTTAAKIKKNPATKEERTSAKHAAEEIVSKTCDLTGGIFPEDYNINDIFYNSGVLRPAGYWIDKNGHKRDIRRFSLDYKANTLETMTELVNASYGIDNGVADSFARNIDVYAKFGDTAVVTGKIIRVTFTPGYTETLTAALADAGFKYSYDASATFQISQNNFAAAGTFASAAGIKTNVTSFAQQYTPAGTAFFTPVTSTMRY